VSYFEEKRPQYKYFKANCYRKLFGGKGDESFSSLGYCVTRIFVSYAGHLMLLG